MESIQDGLTGFVDWVMNDGLRLAAIVVGGTIVAVVLARLTRIVVGRLLHSGIASLEERQWDEAKRLLPRLRTLEVLINRTITSAVMVIVLFLVAQDAGLRVEPILASAGLVGIAIAFGSQTLVRDTLSGVFLLWDGTYNVGDYVRINTVEGIVADISLRRTRLVGDDGTVHTIPNGAVTVISNFTREVVHHSMTLRLSRETPTATVDTILREIATEMSEAPEIGDELVSGPSLAGVTTFRGSTYEVEVRSTVRPTLRRRWPRLLNRRLIEGFERHGVRIPD
jgi:moderate conductance mechanosensitive channel